MANAAAATVLYRIYELLVDELRQDTSFARPMSRGRAMIVLRS